MFVDRHIFLQSPFFFGALRVRFPPYKIFLQSLCCTGKAIVEESNYKSPRGLSHDDMESSLHCKLRQFDSLHALLIR